MTTPTDVSPPTTEPVATAEAPRPRPSRLNQALAWVGIVAGGVFIVAAIFFSGFFLSWGLGGGSWHHHMGPASMAGCHHMKSGEPMMKPDEHMKPSAPMRPGGDDVLAVAVVAV